MQSFIFQTFFHYKWLSYAISSKGNKWSIFLFGEGKLFLQTIAHFLSYKKGVVDLGVKSLPPGITIICIFIASGSIKDFWLNCEIFYLSKC